MGALIRVIQLASGKTMLNPQAEPDPWLLCPQCFRVFRTSEKLRYDKWCPYPDCKWDQKLSPYTVDFWSLRLLNPHLPKVPKPGVIYAKGTRIAIPHGLSEAELGELVGRLRKLDESKEP